MEMGSTALRGFFLTFSLIFLSFSGQVHSASTVDVSEASEEFRSPSCADEIAGIETMVIVDPVSTGFYLLEKARELGYQVVIVQSSPKPVEALKDDMRKALSLGVHAALVVHSGDLEDTLAQLEFYRPTGIIAGSESAVELVDSLTERMGLPSNGTRLSRHLRDKHLMQELLREADPHLGLKPLPHILTDDPEEAIRWVDEHNGGQWPIFIKPPEGAASFGARKVPNAEVLRKKFARLIGTPDPFGNTIREIEVERYIEGDDYAVQITSSAGQPAVTDVMRDWKDEVEDEDGAIALIYSHDELLSLDHPAVAALEEYGLKIVRLFQADWMSVHIESRLTSNGPVFVEINCRHMGGKVPLLVERATGLSPLRLTVESLKGRPDWTEYVADLRQKARRMPAYSVVLRALRQGVIQKGASKRITERLLRELPSFHEGALHIHDGAEVVPGFELLNSPGDVQLWHPDPAQLRRDLRRLRELEEENLLEIF